MVRLAVLHGGDRRLFRSTAKQVWWYFGAANVFFSVVVICFTRPENGVRQSVE